MSQVVGIKDDRAEQRRDTLAQEQRIHTEHEHRRWYKPAAAHALTLEKGLLLALKLLALPLLLLVILLVAVFILFVICCRAIGSVGRGRTS